MPRSTRLLLIKLTIVLGSSLFGIILIEAVMSLTGLEYARVWEPDPELGWRHVPYAARLWTEEGKGLIKINSDGHRDRERRIEKPPGTFRIAIFGDSMTEAVQVNLDQTFCYLLEEMLRAQGQRVEVLNFGVNGYSPIQELVLFKRQGPRYLPDLIIWAAYLDNDVSGSHPELTVSQGGVPFLRTEDRQGIHFDYSRAEQSFKEYNVEPVYSLRKYSSIYRLLSALRWRLKERKQYTQASVKNKIPTRYLLYQKPLRTEWEEAWTTMERVILEFAAEARRLSSRFVILSIPAPRLVNSELWRNTIAKFPAMASTKWDVEGPERRLRAFAYEHDILLLQPYEIYQQAIKRPLFWGDIGHFSPAGHQLMAEVLYDFLNRQGFVSGHKEEIVSTFTP